MENRDLYLMVGISGAGKTTWIKNTTKNFERNEYRIISPDNERKKLTGDISNQECSGAAFFNCFQQLRSYTNDKTILRIYWDATNLSTKSLNDIMKLVKNAELNWIVHLVCFEDSRDWQLCYNRVETDLANGVERSRSTNCFNEISGLPVIQDMSERYINLVDNVLEDWCKRKGVDKFYIGGSNAD